MILLLLSAVPPEAYYGSSSISYLQIYMLYTVLSQHLYFRLALFIYIFRGWLLAACWLGVDITFALGLPLRDAFAVVVMGCLNGHIHYVSACSVGRVLTLLVRDAMGWLGFLREL